MTREERAQLIYEALGHAVNGDAERAADLLVRIGCSSTPTDMFGVCCGLAHAGKHVLGKLGLTVDLAAGDVMALIPTAANGQLPDDPAGLFSTRFLVAYCNDDYPTCNALFDTALRAHPDEYVASVCALLANVAGLARLANAELSAGRLPTTESENP